MPSFGGEIPVPDIVVDPDQYFTGEPTEIFGLAPDSVRSISVVVDGKENSARLANNAYFYQLEDGMSYPTKLVVAYSDGNTATVSIPPPPPAN